MNIARTDEKRTQRNRLLDFTQCLIRQRRHNDPLQRLTRKLHRYATALMMMFAVLLTACGGGADIPGVNNSNLVQVTVGVNGGTVTGPDGVQVIIPAGALNQPTTIGIARSAAGAPAAPDAFPITGNVYELTPHDLPFNLPVTVRAPVGNAPDTQVFMASPGQDWIPTNAVVTNGVAEWQRNSFSWMYVGGCFIPTSMANDPHWCRHGRSVAGISAAPSQAMTQTELPRDPANGDFGAYRVDQAATLTLTSQVKVPGNCSNVSVKLVRRSWIEPQQAWFSVQPQTLATQNPTMTASGNYLAGTATFSVAFSDFDNGKNMFAFSVSYDCPSIIRTPNGSGYTYSWNINNPRHLTLRGDGIKVEGNITPPAVTHTIGGTVSGLTGTGLVLQNNAGNNLTVAANGAFTFATPVGAGSTYNVSVLTQPAGQICTVTSGSGTANAPVTNVAVSCIPTYTIGGSVSGLVGTGLVLQNNGADNLSINASGVFTFATRLAAGAAYNATIQAQPSDSTCTVTNGSGTANADVANITVLCVSSGPLLLVANSGVTNGVNGLSVYRADTATGAPSFLSNVNAGNTPWSVALTPNGLYGYVGNWVGGTISSYSINSTAGTVSPIPLSSPVSNNPTSIAMDRLGRFIWVTNWGYHTVSAFSIGTNGVLAAAGVPMTGLALPYKIVAHSTADFVYIVNSAAAGGQIAVYSVNSSTGALTLLQTLGNAVSSPESMVIDPSGRFLYVANDSGSVGAFAINATTGQLTTIGYVNTGSGAYGIAMHPNGQYVYAVSSATSNNVRVFAINPTTGALTLAAGSPYSAGSNPRGVAVNATGTKLYVTNYVSNTVSAFSIGGSTLTPLGTPIATGSNPTGIAVVP